MTTRQSTNDTGSIVIMATFLNNYSSANEQIFAIIATFSFAASLVSVILSHSLSVRRLSTTVNDLGMLPSKKIKNIIFIPTFLAYVSFLLGISFLALFITSNI